MSVEFTRSLLRISVAQLCQNLGWNAVQMTPMELLTDVMEKYILEIGRHTHTYGEQFGRTVPNLDDVGLAFQEMGISLEELEEYTTHVEPLPFALDVPQFPAPKETLLHFPSLNCKELQSREEYIYDYLPSMHPEWEDLPSVQPVMTLTQLSDKPAVSPESAPISLKGSAQITQTPDLPPGGSVEKRPTEDSIDGAPSLKQQRSLPEEAAPSQYLMKNVHMSNSGFLSGATGTLPDACTPPPPTPQTVMPATLERKSEMLTVPQEPTCEPMVIGESLEASAGASVTKIQDIDGTKVRHDESIITPKSARVGKPLAKSPKSSATSKSKLLSKGGSSLPKGMAKIPKLKRKEGKVGKASKGGKSPRPSVKVKKIKIPKLKSSAAVVKLLGDVDNLVQVENSQLKMDVSSSKAAVIPHSLSEEVVKVSPPAEEPRSKVVPAIRETYNGSPQWTPSPGRMKSPARGRSPSKRRSPGRGKSPGRGRSPGRMKSPRKPGRSQLEELLVKKSGKEELLSKTDGDDVHDSGEDLAKKNAGLTCKVDIISSALPPAATPRSAQQSPAIQTSLSTSPVTQQVSLPSVMVTTKSEVARDKECRLASYDDTIESVLQQTADFPSTEDMPSPSEVSIYKPSPKAEMSHKIKSKKESKDLGMLPSLSLCPIKESPKTNQSAVSHSVFDFDEVSNESFSSPSIKEKHKGNKKSRQKIRITENILPSSDLHEDKKLDEVVIPDVPTFRDEKLIQTSQDVGEFSYSSPERHSTVNVGEEGGEKPMIQPIRIDISQPKLTIKIADVEKKIEREVKKVKKNKKNKDREKSKEKKNKQKKKEKKEKQKKEKQSEEKEQLTTVGGQGFPKLTLKIGGLKTTPSISKADKKSEVVKSKPESLKLIIKPFLGDSGIKSKKSKAPPSLPSSPSPTQRSPSPSNEPLPEPFVPEDTPPVEAMPSTVSSPVESLRSPSPVQFEACQRRATSPAQDDILLGSYTSVSPRPVIKDNSPMELVPDFTFSPSPSPPPHVEVPMSRSPTPSPTPMIREIDKEPSVIQVEEPDDEDEEEDVNEDLSETSATRAIITETVGIIKDENGQTIWICPACKMQDDGSPMIGCDRCDDWYHWPCVGIKKEPPEEQQWFCPRCRIVASKGFDKKQKATKAKSRKKNKKKS